VSVSVTCKSGVLTGGGAGVSGVGLGGSVALVDSHPVGNPPTSWRAEAEQVAGVVAGYTLTAYAICAP
jgi:uncharacterized protein YfiM (DUF2279 family)